MVCAIDNSVWYVLYTIVYGMCAMESSVLYVLYTMCYIQCWGMVCVPWTIVYGMWYGQ